MSRFIRVPRVIQNNNARRNVKINLKLQYGTGTGRSVRTNIHVFRKLETSLRNSNRPERNHKKIPPLSPRETLFTPGGNRRSLKNRCSRNATTVDDDYDSFNCTDST